MGTALRRVVLVLVPYAILSWFVLGAAGWFRRALALPALFETLLVGGLWIGAPVAAVLAWHYPSLGSPQADDVPPESGGPGPTS